jgi:tight adherence protein C
LDLANEPDTLLAYMTLLVAVLMVLTALIAVRLLSGAVVRRRSVQLVDASVEENLLPRLLDDGEGEWFPNWLARAGFRDPSAAPIFWGATAGLTAFGLFVFFLLTKFGVIEAMVRALSYIPGGTGDALAVVAQGAPYFIVVIFAATPTLIVRAARRKRVEAIEQDLAPTLELLATLAEAGLGFDSAIARIQESESGTRPLSQEFQIYQRDNLGGIPRLESLRKLARRAGVTSVSIFVSALIQAEQVGASLAEILRTQADDLRDRRKLHALLLAQALPVKLVFPLMFCFLPGIFFPTLGPVVSQFVDIADSILKR